MSYLMRNVLLYDTRLEDTAVESIVNDLFESCQDHYGEEGHPPEGAKSAPEGAVPADPPMELGGEWLTEAAQRDKSSRNENWRSNQHKMCSEQAKDFERLNDDFTPIWPLDNGNVLSDASISNYDASTVIYDENFGSFVPCCIAPEGATYPQVQSCCPTPRPPTPLPSPSVQSPS